MGTEIETCANCGRMIGKLELPHLWNDQVVCQSCHEQLSGSTLASVAAAASQTNRTVANKPLVAGQIICPNPNCGYRGYPKKERKGSVIVTIGLLILWIIPGIIYALVMDGYRLKCPRCGMQVGETRK